MKKIIILLILFTGLLGYGQLCKWKESLKNDLYASNTEKNGFLDFFETNNIVKSQAYKILYKEKPSLRTNLEELTLVSKNLDKIKNAGGYLKWKDLANAGGKIKIPTQLAGKLGVKTSKLDNWLVKYADDLGDDATKLLDDLKDNIGNKQVLEVLEDAQGRLTVVAKGDGITNDVISLQKNVDGNYVNVTYNRAYNPTANMDIDVALSKNKLVPDYTKTQAGVLSTKYLYPKNLLPKGKSPVVRIKMTGKRTGKGGDFDLANQQAGLTGTKAPEGYVWHHMDDFDPITGECTMQLVKSNAHTKVKGMAHSGSVAQYKAYYVNKDKAPNGLFY